MKWVCFPVLQPFNWPWLRISPDSFLCYLLFDPYCLTIIDDNLPVFLCNWTQLKPTEEKAPGPSPLRDRPPFLPRQIMSWYTYSHPWWMGALWAEHPPKYAVLCLAFVTYRVFKVHWCSMYQYLIHFYDWNNIPLYGYTLFTQRSAE